MFGPQKGGNRAQLIALEQNLLHYIKIVWKHVQMKIKDVPGTDAADGSGAVF